MRACHCWQSSAYACRLRAHRQARRTARHTVAPPRPQQHWLVLQPSPRARNGGVDGRDSVHTELAPGGRVVAVVGVGVVRRTQAQQPGPGQAPRRRLQPRLPAPLPQALQRPQPPLCTRARAAHKHTRTLCAAASPQPGASCILLKQRACVRENVWRFAPRQDPQLKPSPESCMACRSSRLSGGRIGARRCASCHVWMLRSTCTRDDKSSVSVPLTPARANKKCASTQ